MFFHIKELQYEAKPDRPDPVFARKLQEILGGQFGEISVMLQYLFQGWNLRGNGKYKDMLMDIGTEEIAHVIHHLKSFKMRTNRKGRKASKLYL